MNTLEYRPKVGFFLKKKISRFLQKWNFFKEIKHEKNIEIYCKENTRHLFYFIYNNTYFT